MKAMPTLEGGLRLDPENNGEWEMLRSVTRDARWRKVDLADELAGLIGEDAGAEDWREYVVPELRNSFRDDLNNVSISVEKAARRAKNGVGKLWITPGDAPHWYSALNQARLALEERFHFGPTEEMLPPPLTPEGGEAYLRAKFYIAIQSLLLEYVMK